MVTAVLFACAVGGLPRLLAVIGRGNEFRPIGSGLKRVVGDGGIYRPRGTRNVRSSVGIPSLSHHSESVGGAGGSVDLMEGLSLLRHNLLISVPKTIYYIMVPLLGGQGPSSLGANALFRWAPPRRG